MPFILFYVIQIVLVFEYRDLSVAMFTGKNIITLLCKYDSCKDTGIPTCLSNQGHDERKAKDPPHFDVPLDCHLNMYCLKNNKSLNPFKRIREDFIVLVGSIFLPVIFLQTKGIITIPENVADSFLGLYGISILSIYLIGIIYKPDKDNVVSLLFGVHICFGFILYWFLEAFQINWYSIPNLSSIGPLSLITNNFTINLSFFLMISIWLTTFIATLIWRLKVPKDDTLNSH